MSRINEVLYLIVRGRGFKKNDTALQRQVLHVIENQQRKPIHAPHIQHQTAKGQQIAHQPAGRIQTGLHHGQLKRFAQTEYNGKHQCHDPAGYHSTQRR